MRLFGLLLAFFFSYASISLAQNLTTKFDSVSYSVGMIVAENLKNQGFTDLNEAIIADAIHDIISDGQMELTKREADQIFKAYLKELKESIGKANKEAGETFLAENSKRNGVTTLPSGLQFEVMVEGTGASPGPLDKVKTHYHGTLIDGTVFDSSVERGEPISFSLNRVIKAWQEALPLMKEGAKYKIYAPYNLAYGERGSGAKIKPFSTLIFEIELLEVIKSDAQK